MLERTAEVMAAIEVTSPWQAVLQREPEPHPWVPESRLESVRSLAQVRDLDVRTPNLEEIFVGYMRADDMSGKEQGR